jgi:hypothetical protein
MTSRATAGHRNALILVIATSSKCYALDLDSERQSMQAYFHVCISVLWTWATQSPTYATHAMLAVRTEKYIILLTM